MGGGRNPPGAERAAQAMLGQLAWWGEAVKEAKQRRPYRVKRVERRRVDCVHGIEYVHGVVNILESVNILGHGGWAIEPALAEKLEEILGEISWLKGARVEHAGGA